jgi:hypothetical protein
MTAKATFKDGISMMFGDSYKRWWTQLAEYCATHQLDRPAVVVSSQPWAGCGLKWCTEMDLQEELEAEGAGRCLWTYKWRPLNLIEFRIFSRLVPVYAHKVLETELPKTSP